MSFKRVLAVSVTVASIAMATAYAQPVPLKESDCTHIDTVVGDLQTNIYQRAADIYAYQGRSASQEHPGGAQVWFEFVAAANRLKDLCRTYVNFQSHPAVPAATQQPPVPPKMSIPAKPVPKMN